ncbi:alpha/beta fold hydrolase [Roseovarius sp. M141]|uniref:alpha/beta fold hydrolase n=1 Tax=Roseovarius sp. M141 TaxID=2583806 RepID=UPI0020CD8DD0|nr:alpha/beta fold hydrolase [Roseovarius sp. M141]MCQ0094109.1 alpha/beta fold hydrolase [Roseovarius sp. M141]
MTWLLLALAVLFLAPFAREAARPTMSGRARQDAPGQFADLPQGRTHYRWLGADSGPVAVCVHGLTTPSPVWTAIAEGLGEMGYRVLIYDLNGRGYSDRPRGLQDCAFFVRQLSDLLADQGIVNDVTLLGYSMGGAIVPAFAAQRPDMLRQIVLIAPAGLGHDLGPGLRLMAGTGALGRWAMLSVYGRSMRRACAAQRDQPVSVPGITQIQIGQLRHRGFIPAVLSSLHGALNEHMEQAHRTIAAVGVPLLAIWGAADEIIPPSGKDTLSDWNPDATHHIVPQAGHALPYSHSSDALKAMRPHLIHVAG